MTRNRRSGRGFSLFEMVLATALFTVLMGLIFYFLGMGNRGFQFAQSKASVQNQVLAIRATLKQDLEQGHFLGLHSLSVNKTVNKKNGTGQVQARRDIVSAVTLTHWVMGNSNPNQGFSWGGLPLWDSFVVYRPDQTVDASVNLKRFVLSGNSVSTAARGLAEPPNFSTMTSLLFEPGSDPAIVKAGLIAEAVSHFEVSLDYTRQMVNVKVRILEGHSEVTDNFEQNRRETTVVIGIRPKNTVPKL